MKGEEEKRGEDREREEDRDKKKKERNIAKERARERKDKCLERENVLGINMSTHMRKHLGTDTLMTNQ